MKILRPNFLIIVSVGLFLFNIVKAQNLHFRSSETLNLGFSPALSPQKPTSPPINYFSPWVNHEFNRLSRRQKIAQLFMVAAYSNMFEEFSDSVGKVISRFQPGGLIFFQGGPVRESVLLNRYQKSLKVKAMVAMDAEWGLAMRLDSTLAYPYQMTLGALDSSALIFQMGGDIGRQLHRIGVQVNFAPVLDINNNIKNTVINFRSFGENKFKVSEKGLEYIRGLQQVNILATGKHFPGHGDTEVDSHSDLPKLPFSVARLDSLELYPFRRAIQSGIGGMMIAHMNIPAWDTTNHLPSSLSHNIVQKVLIDQLGFQGLTFTDAMNMKGVLKYFPVGNAEFLALNAGNDMIEMSTNLRLSLKTIRKAIRKKQISRDSIEKRCRKILAWKEWMGLSHYSPVVIENLVNDLNTPVSNQLIQQLSDSSITLVRNENSFLKNVRVKNQKGLILNINPGTIHILDSGLALAYQIPIINLIKNADSVYLDSIKLKLKAFDYLIILIHDSRLRPSSNLNYSKSLMNFISEIGVKTNSYITLLANPYTLFRIPMISKATNLLITYQDANFTENSALKFWLGKIPASGHLPVTIPGVYSYGEGIRSKIK